MIMGVYFLPDDDPSVIIQPDLTMSESHDKTAVITDHPTETGTNISDHVRIENRRFSCVVYITRTPTVPNRPVRPNATDKVDPTEGPGGNQETVELTIPQFSPPFDGTPGALFRAAGAVATALVDAITGGPKPTKAYGLLLFPEVFDPVALFQEKLEDMQEGGVTSSIVTTTKTYENMLIEQISMPITEAGGAEFTIQFRQIRVVSSASVQAPKPSVPSGNPKANKGGQSPNPTNGPDAVKASVAKQLANKVLGLVGL